MLSLVSFGLFCLASIVRAQLETGCATTSASVTTTSLTIASSCTLFYTPSIPPQIGPTSTVYASMLTTQFNVVNCEYCQISNVAENPVPTGPFTTKVTSDCLFITHIACIPTISSLTRGAALPEETPQPTAWYIRGARPRTFTSAVKQDTIPIPQFGHRVKRQVPANATSLAPILTGEAFQLIEQLFTVLFSIGVINSGTDLEESCTELQSANAILDLAAVGINSTQAATIICSTSLPNAQLSSFNQTLIASGAAALYGVQIAANFLGTVDAGQICRQLDLSPLPTLGVDVDAIRAFICKAANSTTTGMATATVTVTQTTSLVRTSIPYPYTNSSEGGYTWAGGFTASGSARTNVTAPPTTGPSSDNGIYSSTIFTASTTVDAVGNPPLSTGTGVSPSLPVGTGIWGTGNVTAGTGLTTSSGTGVTITGDVSAEYPSSSADAESSTEGGDDGYGYERRAFDRVPRGPTLTPRYYPRYF